MGGRDEGAFASWRIWVLPATCDRLGRAVPALPPHGVTVWAVVQLGRAGPRGVRALVLYPQPDEVVERKISRRVGRSVVAGVRIRCAARRSQRSAVRQRETVIAPGWFSRSVNNTSPDLRRTSPTARLRLEAAHAGRAGPGAPPRAVHPRREPGGCYRYCLPSALSAYNLLPRSAPRRSSALPQITSRGRRPSTADRRTTCSRRRSSASHVDADVGQSPARRRRLRRGTPDRRAVPIRTVATSPSNTSVPPITWVRQSRASRESVAGSARRRQRRDPDTAGRVAASRPP